MPAASPLSMNVTEVFRLHPECFDAETRAHLDAHGDPFGFRGLRYIESREEWRHTSVIRPAVAGSV